MITQHFRFQMPGKSKSKQRFPPGQVKRIIQQDDDVGKMAAAVPVMVAKMSEIFITRLLEQSGRVMEDRGSRTLSVDHVAGAIREDVRLDFLMPLVKNMRETERKSKSPIEKKSKSPVDKIITSKSPEDSKAKPLSDIKKVLPISKNNNKRKDLFTTNGESKSKKQKYDVSKNDVEKVERESNSSNDDNQMISTNSDNKQMISAKFTITTLLNTNQPQLILTHPIAAQLDEDYD